MQRAVGPMISSSDANNAAYRSCTPEVFHTSSFQPFVIADDTSPMEEAVRPWLFIRPTDKPHHCGQPGSWGTETIPVAHPRADPPMQICRCLRKTTSPTVMSPAFNLRGKRSDGSCLVSQACSRVRRGNFLWWCGSFLRSVISLRWEGLRVSLCEHWSRMISALRRIP